MPLTYNELANLFPNRRGINDSVLHFHTVTTFSQVLQPKGIFIPVYRDSGELNEAIENGAIAAIWDEEKALPSYTPSYFPVFLTNDLWKGLEDMLNQLSKKISSSEIIESDQTTFCLFRKNSLNIIRNTYDIAEVVKEFTILNKQTKREGRA
jgi:UDP-N-acetylmuramyl pentapeptide synthase